MGQYGATFTRRLWREYRIAGRSGNVRTFVANLLGIRSLSDVGGLIQVLPKTLPIQECKESGRSVAGFSTSGIVLVMNGQGSFLALLFSGTGFLGMTPRPDDSVMVS